MPDPPQFVNYANPDAIPASSSRPTSRPANFGRSSNRTNQPRSDFIPPPDEEPNPNSNVAGVGSGRRNSVLVSDPAINSSSGQRQVNGYGPGGSGQSSGPPPAAVNFTTPQTMPKTGDQQHLVKPDHDSQSFKPGHSPGGSNVGQENDPLAMHMAELRNAGVGGRRNSFVQKEPQQESGPARARDYNSSADMVVGGYPSASRPVSPSQPTAALMRPPQNAAPSPNVNVDNVLEDYHQSLPGEGKSHSRSASRQSQVGSSQLLDRPAPREGFVGIGSQGRSSSPAFNGNEQRNTSPIPPHQGSVSRPSTNSAPGHTARQDSVNINQLKLPNRATTPNSVGISLDKKGNVAIDSMADVYQPQHNQTASQPSQQHHAPPQNPQSTGFQRRLSTSHSNGSMNGIPGQQSHIPPQAQPPYGAPPPAPYQQPPPAQQPPPLQQQPHYMQPPTQQPPINYHYPPQPEYAQPPAHPPYTQPQQELTRVQSISSPYYQQLAQPPQPQQLPNGYRSASPQPMHNPPVQAQPHGVTAAPTGQYTEAGRPVLFYGVFRVFNY